MHRVSKGEWITSCEVSDWLSWHTLKHSDDTAVAIKLQAQAWQATSRIKADGAIEADRELENRTGAIGARSRQLETGDLGDVLHWNDIHRHRYR